LNSDLLSFEMARKDKTRDSPDAPPPFPEGWRFVRLDTKLARIKTRR
jgi:hypothetical protein